ncbi:MAG: hypothetical protein QOI59_4127 [Gammaproteobacteria bacterium]|nr:hypothetical protein [Gammaproteobacteria bacterium]
MQEHSSRGRSSSAGRRQGRRGPGIVIAFFSWNLRRFRRPIIAAVLCIFEERVVFLDIADVRSDLLQLRNCRATLGLGGVVFEDAFEGVIGRLAQRIAAFRARG